jgi:hypothetical protein
MLSKQPLMSPSRIHLADVFLQSTVKHFSIASAVDLLSRNPYEFASAVHSAIGSSAKQVKRLHRTVCHRRNSERTHLAVALRDVHPSQAPRLVPALFERQHGSRFEFRCRPRRSVYSRCPFALILRYSLHGLALPLSERTSIRCKAFALRRLPSCHAFTIRNCKLLTRRWQSDQFVPRRSKVEPECACVD